MSEKSIPYAVGQSSDDRTVYRVEVQHRSTDTAAADHGFVVTAQHLGISGLHTCCEARLYFLQGILSAQDIERLCTELLSDPVTETFSITQNLQGTLEPISVDDAHSVDITLLPGVTDAAAESLLRAARFPESTIWNV